MGLESLDAVSARGADSPMMPSDRGLTELARRLLQEAQVGEHWPSQVAVCTSSCNLERHRTIYNRLIVGSNF